MKYRREVTPDGLLVIIGKIEMVKSYFLREKNDLYHTANNLLEYLNRANSLVRDDTKRLVIFYTSAEISLFTEYQAVKSFKK
jgi:hypothetical protein